MGHLLRVLQPLFGDAFQVGVFLMSQRNGELWYGKNSITAGEALAHATVGESVAH